jgi:hypothetical protein
MPLIFEMARNRTHTGTIDAHQPDEYPTQQKPELCDQKAPGTVVS